MRVGSQIGIVTATVFFFTAVAPLETWGGEADAKREQARQFFEAGKRFYEMQNWRAAIDQFKQAATIIPSPILDYNIALCYEKLGKPRTAIKYYKRYLQGMPQADNRTEVEAKIATLEAQVAAQSPPAQQQPPQGGQPNVAPGVPPPAPSPGGPQPGQGQPTGAQAQVPPPAGSPEGDDEFVPPPPEYPLEGFGDYSYMGKSKPTRGGAVKPITHQWWFWVLIAVGVTFTLALAIYLATAPEEDIYAAGRSGLKLNLSPQGQVMRPLGHRPLLYYPPDPAGVLVRF